MRMCLPALAVAAVIGATASQAQTQAIGPGGVPMAPGPSQPHDFTPGGIGPGGVPVAPGPAARGINIERIGPGGVPLAPGPAGSVGTGPTLAPQALAPRPGGVRLTIGKRRHLHGPKVKRRARPID